MTKRVRITIEVECDDDDELARFIDEYTSDDLANEAFILNIVSSKVEPL